MCLCILEDARCQNESSRNAQTTEEQWNQWKI